MTFRNCLAVILCFSLSASVWAQDLKLDEAKTFADVAAYMQQERGKLTPSASVKEDALALANLLLPASEKLLEVAQNDMEKRSGYNMKLQALQQQITAEVEGAKEKCDAYLDELAAHEEANARNFAATYRFGQLRSVAIRAMGRESSPATFNEFKSELKAWVNQKDLTVANIRSLGLVDIAERNNVPPEQFIRELITFVQSPECTLSAERKTELLDVFEGLLRLTVGSDPKLYGRTLDDKEFDWEELRKKNDVKDIKYVLIQFTATWCGPCQMEMPGMLEAYEKYHDKGFEIVSVYVWQREVDPVATVKDYVEEKKLPWIILSEELSKRAKHPEFGTHYVVDGVPTMVLTDKEGKIIMTNARGERLQAKLAEIFK